MSKLRWVSPETKPKEEDFRGIIRMHTTLCTGILPRSSTLPYLYADLYAGPGWIAYGDDAFEGSPLLAQQAMVDAGFPYESIHFEQDPATAAQLMEALWAPKGPTWRPDPDGELVFAERCQEGFARWLDETGRQADRYGLVYADPINDEIPHALLNKAAGLLPRVDLLSYVAANQYKRRRGGELRRNGWSDRPLLTEHIAAVRKRYVLIREPIGAWQFTFILWTNWAGFPVWEKRGFYRLDSPRGGGILDRLNLTHQELHARRNTQLPFFRTAPTPSTSDTHDSAPSGRRSSNGPTGSASGAGSAPRPSRTTSSTRAGGSSTSPTTSLPSATSATAEPTGRTGDRSSMSAYLIEVDDAKEGVCYPTIVGPFADAEAARSFAQEMQMGTAAQAGQGGYSAVHVIADETCDYAPERYREEYAWRVDQEA